MTGATSVLPSARAILSAVYSMTNLCSPSTMCGPFCSVPAVPMMTVVVPLLTRSRASAQVSSSMNTVSGGLPEGAVGGALAGRWAASAARQEKSVTDVKNSFFMPESVRQMRGGGRPRRSFCDGVRQFLPRGLAPLLHRDRQFFVVEERAVVRSGAEDVGARRVEGGAGDNLAVGRQRGRIPQRRPRRIGAGARVFPRLYLHRVEANVARAAVDEPHHVKARALTNRDAAWRIENRIARRIGRCVQRARDGGQLRGRWLRPFR